MNVLMLCIFSYERVESDMFFDKKHEDFFSSENRWVMVTVGETLSTIGQKYGFVFLYIFTLHCFVF